MPADPPFIYIAAIRRTGSKVLSHALSQVPHAYIFREPGLARGNFNLGKREAETLAVLGLDLPVLLEELPKHPRGQRVKVFRDSILPEIQKHVAQVGIKEIRNRHWQRLADAFPELKVIVVARDPRDIFLSLAHKAADRGVAWNDSVNPEDVAAHINEQFTLQREMLGQLECYQVRYEDFCADRCIIERLRVFAGSRVSGMGSVETMERAAWRKAKRPPVHDQKITTRRVARWRAEEDPSLQKAATETARLLGEYMEFWRYDVQPTGALG